MKLDKNKIKNLLWITPAIVAFLIALIPTLKFQWPLTVDIFFHIHIAQVYSQYGFTLIDPLIDPGMGYKIGNMPLSDPPLFSLFIVFLGSILKIDYFQVARLLQPILAFSVVLSVSYVAKKFYGDIAGISAGFLLISSYLFSRLVSPLPETMALIFVPLAVYFYYKSVEDKNYLYALVSGIFFVLTLVTHYATTLILFLVITAVAIVLGILRRNIRYFISYATFLLIPVVAGGIVVIALFLMEPGFMQSMFTAGLSVIKGYATLLPNNEPISNLKYIAFIGIALLFAIIGGMVALRKRRDQDLIVIIWIITIFLLSKAYWVGINVFSIRLLIHLLIPVSILGGLGLSYLYFEFRKKEITSKKIRSGFLIATFVLASLFAITTVQDPNFALIPKYDTELSQVGLKAPQIAPPTDSDIDLANWFNKNGDKKSVIISNNYFTNQFLLAATEQPIASPTNSAMCILWGYKKFVWNKAKAGYFVYDKRLNVSSGNSSKIINEGYYLFFDINYAMKSILPDNARKAYENKNYIIFRLN